MFYAVQLERGAGPRQPPWRTEHALSSPRRHRGLQQSGAGAGAALNQPSVPSCLGDAPSDAFRHSRGVQLLHISTKRSEGKLLCSLQFSQCPERGRQRSWSQNVASVHRAEMNSSGSISTARAGRLWLLPGLLLAIFQFKISRLYAKISVSCWPWGSHAEALKCFWRHSLFTVNCHLLRENAIIHFMSTLILIFLVQLWEGLPNTPPFRSPL